MKAHYVELFNKNDNGRGSSLHINGSAFLNDRIDIRANNPTTGGRLDGSGTVTSRNIELRDGATLGGTLTLNLVDNERVYVFGDGVGGRIAPGPVSGGAGKLTMNRLQISGNGHYRYDGGDLVDVTSFLRLEDNWNLDLLSTGARLTSDPLGSLKLFKRAGTLEAFDTTPNINYSSLVNAGWISQSYFDNNTLTLTDAGGFIMLNGIKIRPPAWTGLGGDNNWSTGSNWDIPFEAGNPVIFAGSTRTSPNNDFADGTSVISVEFDNTAASFTLGGNRINLTEGITNNSSNAQTINMAMTIAPSSTVNTGAQNMTINGNLDGTGGVLTKSGSGTLYLAGNNTQTGGVGINEGTVSVATSTALGGAGATVRFGGGSLAVTAPISSPAGLAVNSGGGTLAIGSNAVTFAGTNSGSGTLTKTGAGTLTLSGTGSTFSGTINVTQGALVGSSASISSNVALSGGTSVTFNQTVNGAYGKEVSGTGSLIKTGGAILDLNKVSTLSGETLISEGTIRFNISAPVTSGMQVWFDAGQGLTVDGGGRITAWNDISGNNRNATGVGNGGPTFVANGINGLPTAQFRNQWLDLNGNSNVATQYIVFKSGRTDNPNIFGPDWSAPFSRTDQNGWMLRPNDNNFWDGNRPNDVAQNGVELNNAGDNWRFTQSPVSNYMVMKVDNNTTANTQYSLGRNG